MFTRLGVVGIGFAEFGFGEQGALVLLKRIHAEGAPVYPDREAWQGMHFIR